MKKFFRNLLNAIGYDIVKVNVHADSKAGKVKKVQVGKFVIDMPGNNVQISTYKYRPDANSILGTLAAAIAEKYPDLAVIDIGANVGDTIAVIKSAIDVPVIGIEGDAISFGFLQKNAPLFSNLTLIQSFLGEKKENIQVAFEKSGWNTTLVPSANGQTLSLKTLDEVLSDEGLFNRTLKMLKIDCEGFDTIILRGAGELLQKHRPVIFFEYNKTNMNAIGEDGLSTLFSMEQYGYHSALFFDNYGRFMLRAPLSDKALISALHDYTEDGVSQVGYYDICLFHQQDEQLSDIFMKSVKPV
jgi:FkbM family methyltransferase